MATSTVSGVWYKSSTTAIAAFRDLHLALLNVGLNQTSDTGQLNMSTAGPTFVATNGYNYGYTVYSWSDSAQSTYPIYLRVDWVNNAAASSVVGILVTVGTGSNGSGTITGVVAGPTTFNGGVADNATYSTYVCYANGCLSIALNPGGAQANNRFVCIVDRVRTLDGTPCGGIWTTLISPYATLSDKWSSPARTTIATFAHASAVSSTNLPAWPLGYPYWAELSTLTVSSVTPFLTPSFFDPAGRTTLGPVLVPQTEISLATTMTISRFGTNHTYLSLGAYMSAYPLNQAHGSTRWTLGILWE